MVISVGLVDDFVNLPPLPVSAEPLDELVSVENGVLFLFRSNILHRYL